MFYYVPHLRRCVPYVIPAYQPVSRMAYGEVKKIISRLPFEYEIVSDTQNGEVVISVDQENIEGSLEDLTKEIEQSMFGSRFCSVEIETK